MEQTLVVFLPIRFYVSVSVTITPRLTFDNKHTRYGKWHTNFAAVGDFFQEIRSDLKTFTLFPTAILA